MRYLETLNPEQKEAVLHGEGPMLILAGAGSGKTRVLTYRIAHLIANHKVSPENIFAVTFTNKAAAEMRQRVFKILGEELGIFVGQYDMWISTFHSACVRFLKSHIHHLGYQNTFTIYDDSDQLSVIKACMKQLNVGESSISPKAVAARINKLKNDGMTLQTYQPAYGGPIEDAFVRVFERYSEHLRVASALDFADLILLTVELFSKHPQVLAGYHQNFKYVLIDEYQDTNRCQYLLMKLLAGPAANICAVGDEDQSIYRWRGADISNILNFERDYPNAKIFRLEQNYRSTKNIIEAASHVIAHNTERHDKTLWTSNEPGESIKIFETYDEHDEASKVTQILQEELQKDFTLNQMAIFYRTNAQSRLLEDSLRTQGFAYEIYGGLKFYARLEVKDALAYLRLIANVDDDVSFRRIVNVPGRGIGQVSLDRLGHLAQEQGLSYYRLLEAIFGERPTVLADLGRARKSFQAFFELMQMLRRQKASLLPSDLLSLVIEESGYRKSLIQENTVEAQSRLENLAELRQSLVEFELRSGAENPQNPITLEAFLEQIALVSDIDRLDPNMPTLKMMTIHMAKGLEFEVVLMVGLEEELFPHIRPWDGEDPSEVEEERRLFYVGMTRAKQKLYLLFAKNRTVFGNKGFRVKSRFLEEIPEEYTEQKESDFFARRRSYIERPGVVPKGYSEEYSQLSPFEDEGFENPLDKIRPGTPIQHPTFGKGVVRKKLGNDKLLVFFNHIGEKKLSLKDPSLLGIE